MSNVVRITNDSMKQIHICQQDFNDNLVGGTTTYLEPGETVAYELRSDNKTVIGVLTPRSSNDKTN